MAEINVPVKKDERVTQWECTRRHPDLAEQLASKRGDLARVEEGFEIRGGIRFEGWLLSIVRPVGNKLLHFTEIYMRKKFKGRDTAVIFLNSANQYFKEEEKKHRAKLH